MEDKDIFEQCLENLNYIKNSSERYKEACMNNVLDDMRQSSHLITKYEGNETQKQIEDNCKKVDEKIALYESKYQPRFEFFSKLKELSNSINEVLENEQSIYEGYLINMNNLRILQNQSIIRLRKTTSAIGKRSLTRVPVNEIRSPTSNNDELTMITNSLKNLKKLNEKLKSKLDSEKRSTHNESSIPTPMPSNPEVQEAIPETTLVVGINVGSETHYARAIDF